MRGDTRSSKTLERSPPPAVATETEEKHLKNLQAVLEAEGKQRQAELQKLDEQMRSRLVSLKEEHEGALRGAEEYYSAVQRKLLEDQRLLKVRRSNTPTPPRVRLKIRAGPAANLLLRPPFAPSEGADGGHQGPGSGPPRTFSSPAGEAAPA